MTVGTQSTVRVCVADAWDTVSLEVTPSHTVGRVKAEGLAAAGRGSVDPEVYEVKYRGALVLDEDATLGSPQVPDGASMIILPARRQPVR
jgi:hypothetical protein